MDRVPTEEEMMRRWNELKERLSQIRPEDAQRMLARIIVHSKIDKTVQEASKMIRSYNPSLEILCYLVRHCGHARNQYMRIWAAEEMLKPENEKVLTNYHLRTIIIYCPEEKLKRKAAQRLLKRDYLEFDDVEVIKKYLPDLAQKAQRKLTRSIEFLVEEITGMPWDIPIERDKDG